MIQGLRDMMYYTSKVVSKTEIRYNNSENNVSTYLNLSK